MKYRPNRKLTPEQVREIRRLRTKGTPKPVRQAGSLMSLAKMFGVSDTLIQRICNRRAYKEID